MVSLISSYASIFELSVALNLTYGASEQLRGLVKSGFLYDARGMLLKYQETANRISAKIGILIDEDIVLDKKEKINLKLESIFKDFKDDEKSLKKELDDTQELSSKQLIPYYVLTAIFSIFILFLGGQESIHEFFPIKDILLINTFMTILFLSFIFIMFSKIELPVLYSAGVTIFIFLLIVSFSDNIFQLLNLSSEVSHNKYYVNLSLFYAFLPFVFATFSLSLSSLKLSFKYRLRYFKSNRTLTEVKKHLEAIKESTEYLDLVDTD